MSQKHDSYLGVLRRNPGFFRLWLGQVISLLGDWLSYVAVLGVVLELTDSGLVVAITMLARAIPYTLVGMVSGVILDRFDRKRILILADLFRGGLAVAYLLVRSPDMIWFVYVLGAATQSFSALFNPGMNAVVPSLCKEEDRVTGNALLQATQGFTMVLGSAVGGALVTLVGREWAFILNGISFVASGLLVLTVPIPDSTVKRQLPSAIEQFREGIRYIRSQTVVLGIMLRRFGERLGAGFNILLSVYAVQVWHQGEKGIGALYAILGFGLIAGSWIAKRVGKDAGTAKMQRIIGWGNVGEAVFWTLFAISPNLWVGAAMMVLMVGSDIITNITEVTIIQKVVPNELLGRVFAAREALLTLAWAVALSITGIVMERVGPQPTGLGIGAVMGLTALLWFVALARQKMTPAAPMAPERVG